MRFLEFILAIWIAFAEMSMPTPLDKLNSLSLTYSQPNFEIEKIKTEKKELLRQKIEAEKKNHHHGWPGPTTGPEAARPACRPVWPHRVEWSS